MSSFNVYFLFGGGGGGVRHCPRNLEAGHASDRGNIIYLLFVGNRNSYSDLN